MYHYLRKSPEGPQHHFPSFPFLLQMPSILLWDLEMSAVFHQREILLIHLRRIAYHYSSYKDEGQLR